MLTQRILLSLAVIVAVGGAAVASTGAFFNDTETSTGNSFTAGAIDLTVDSHQYYNGNECKLVGQTYQWVGTAGYPVPGTTCDGTWTNPINLGPTTHFFNFGDVKPGDQGEDTISLHVDNNPAWACVNLVTTSNNENTLTAPEIAAGDTSSTTGELAQNIHVFAWLDNASTSGAVAGDNIWQAGEPILQNVVALSDVSATTTLTLADGGSGSPLPGGSTSYIGMGWCAGTLTINSPGSWSCNGASMDNKSQTDSATADVSFHIEQSRNNPNFRCQPQS